MDVHLAYLPGLSVGRDVGASRCCSSPAVPVLPLQTTWKMAHLQVEQVEQLPCPDVSPGADPSLAS